jgi:hypothetical protein
MLKPGQMAGREERLTPATRNYVIFGLLFVGALALALRDWLDPRERRGAPDSALRLLIVSSDEDGPGQTLQDLDGFNVSRVEPDTARSSGRELLDEDAPDYRAVIAYADELGFGFVALDLVHMTGSWQLDEPVPASARFAVFSVGDVAVEGPRMHAVGLPEDIVFDPFLAKLDSIRLGLFEHPDLTRLWTIEPNVIEGQAHQVFDSRNLDERAAMLKRDHADWSEFVGAWERVPGSLAGPWERVQAAPIPGGLLLEIRPVRVHVDRYRKLRLEVGVEAELAFLPRAGLREPSPDARQTCSGLPERVTGRVAVAPDESAVAIDTHAGTEVFVFEPGPQCQARSLGVFELDGRPIGRPSGNGALAWNYADDWLHWWDALGEHRVRIEGIDGYSGPWWVDSELLALIGERPIPAPTEPDEGFTVSGYEPVLVLLATTPTVEHEPDEARVRMLLGARELFPTLAPESIPPELLDLRPAGSHELLFTTDRCMDATDDDDERPCLHRIRATAPLAVVAREPESEALVIETLGSLDAPRELAVAAGSERIAWIDRATQSLWIADLGGPDRMVPRRLDLEPKPDSSLRISADGRTVLSEIEVEFVLGERVIGSVLVPRAFVLDPPIVDH